MLYIKNKTETYLSLDVDICQGLGTSFTNPVTRMVSEEIHRISNFPYDCPLKKVRILKELLFYNCFINKEKLIYHLFIELSVYD